MKIEFDIYNREFFRTLTFSLKLQKKAQVSIIYMKHIVQWELKVLCSKNTIRNFIPVVNMFWLSRKADYFETDYNWQQMLEIGNNSDMNSYFWFIM
jgi:hypothetical protein